jgi:hypothetical protein
MNKLIRWSQCAVALTLEKPKEVGLLGLLILFLIMAIYKSTPPMVKKVFELQIHKNKVAVKELFQERDIVKSETVWVDKLMLKDGARIMHPKLGVIGFSDSFFIDIAAEFTVNKAGIYYFIPGSDDGFALDIDDQRLCAFEKDRPYSTQRCRIELEKGTHNFKLRYFQGGGLSGLTLAYQFQDDSKQRWVGENSQYMTFD